MVNKKKNPRHLLKVKNSAKKKKKRGQREEMENSLEIIVITQMLSMLNI